MSFRNTACAIVLPASIAFLASGAAWDSDWYDCRPTGNLHCSNLGTIQCVEQGGVGTCFKCTGYSSLPQKTCVRVEDAEGCTPNSQSVYCGDKEKGVCDEEDTPGTECSDFVDSGACQNTQGCD